MVQNIDWLAKQSGEWLVHHLDAVAEEDNFKALFERQALDIFRFLLSERAAETDEEKQAALDGLIDNTRFFWSWMHTNKDHYMAAYYATELALGVAVVTGNRVLGAKNIQGRWPKGRKELLDQAVATVAAKLDENWRHRWDHSHYTDWILEQPEYSMLKDTQADRSLRKELADLFRSRGLYVPGTRK